MVAAQTEGAQEGGRSSRAGTSRVPHGLDISKGGTQKGCCGATQTLKLREELNAALRHKAE
eukprot:scaffold225450_cov17-Tisochrysis_lutea.AAC.1